RGERVSPLVSRARAEFWAVLLIPDLPSIPKKTQTLYNSLSESSFTRGEASRRMVESLSERGPLGPSMLFNVFETVAWEVYPGLAESRKLFQACGAAGVHLAGSGPVLFTLLEERGRAEAICESLRRRGVEACTAQALGRDHG
ncbi:MAG: 4-diphosphocytidyl-2C-methyl-D-erythritol kinase, partial [Dehalococcoidia bacterium]